MPSTDPSVVEFREPYNWIMFCFGLVLLIVCGILAYKLFSYRLPNDAIGWILAFLAIAVLSAMGLIGIMAIFQNEHLVIDRREGVLKVWKNGRIPSKVSDNKLSELVSCVITAQERSDDETFTAYSVRLIFKTNEATVLETRSKSEAKCFAKELSLELGIREDPTLVQQLSEQDELRRLVGLDDSNSDSKS